MTRIQRVEAKSALSPSAMPGLAYALNPYRGCEIGCHYCYAPYVTHALDAPRPRPEAPLAPVESPPLRAWGEFLEVRANLPRLLGRELRQKPRGLVGLGTVTDAYTPYEARSRLTRRCLQKLAGAGWPVSIQTKSRMVLRDLDILQHMEEVDVGLSFSTGDEGTARILEPRASTLADRIFALQSLRQNSIPTWAFLGPLLPGATEEGLEPLLDAIAATGTTTLLVDPLRLKPGMREHLEQSLPGHPGWLRQWDQALRGGPGFRDLEERIRALARERGLKVEPGFPDAAAQTRI